MSKAINWDKEVDVLCVGSGAGGMSAALTAAESGASVLVAEKDTLVGGVQALSSGQIWQGGTCYAEALGIEDSVEETIQYLENIAQGMAVESLRRNYVEKSQEALAFLREQIGIKLQVVRNLPDYYYPLIPHSKAEGRYLEVEPFDATVLGEWAAKCRTSPYDNFYSYATANEWTAQQSDGSVLAADCMVEHLSKDERCSGAGLAAAMLKAMLDRNVEILIESPVTKLISDNGAVIGAEITTSEGVLRVKANKGVLLATSGYDWNEDLVKMHETMPGAGSMCPPAITGDHFHLAADVGAIPVPGRAPAQTPIFAGYKVPGELIYGKPSQRMLLPGWPHSIIVNDKGLRFCNDAFYPDVVTKAWRFDGQGEGLINWPAYLVFDESFREKYNLLPCYPGQELPDGLATKAESIEELANAIGVSSETLCATVNTFNSYCETGEDPEFGRHTTPWGAIMAGDKRQPKHPNFGPLERGPFYAVELVRLVMGVPTAGLRIDENAQVITARGEPAPGLYAGGNSAVCHDVGGGYNSGIANMRGLLHGFLAVNHMLAQAN
jgi:3-oxosteroid 1-dehydrogenase